MCGFIGKIARSEDGAEDLLRGLQWLRRRGPDAQQLWSSSDRRVSLLHARLSIVDQDPRAHQPFSDGEAGVTVAFVGEIYNYLEIKPQLSHYRFLTHSDTEVVLAAYLRHGAAGLSMLKGMFALAVVDQKGRRVILARDPIGKKPLFVARWGEDVLFGSSLLPLVAAHKGPVRIRDGIHEVFWKKAYIPPDTTVLTGAVPVLPGHVLEFDWSGHLVNRSSLDSKPQLIYEGEALEEVTENVKSLLEMAVSRRLRNNPEPVALLSGGIDSTVISHVSKALCERTNSLPKLQTLTLRSLIPLMNDEFFARYAAHHIGTRVQLIKPAIGFRRVGELIMQALDLQDEPLGMPSFYVLERLVNAASDHGRILLSGDGGDEVFLGYGKPADWHIGKGEDRTNDMEVPYGPGLPSWMSPWGRLMGTDSLVGHMLAKADRASAEQGVELRCPLLDFDLVKYARSLPFEILVDGGRLKALLKAQLKGWPRWFLERPKVGFAYNLRWLWSLSRFEGLREEIDRRAMDAFEPYLPPALGRPPHRWKWADILRHFQDAWRLLAWSRFLSRLDSGQGLDDSIPAGCSTPSARS